MQTGYSRHGKNATCEVDVYKAQQAETAILCSAALTARYGELFRNQRYKVSTPPKSLH